MNRLCLPGWVIRRGKLRAARSDVVNLG